MGDRFMPLAEIKEEVALPGCEPGCVEAIAGECGGDGFIDGNCAGLAAGVGYSAYGFLGARRPFASFSLVGGPENLTPSFDDESLSGRAGRVPTGDMGEWGGELDATVEVPPTTDGVHRTRLGPGRESSSSDGFDGFGGFAGALS